MSGAPLLLQNGSPLRLVVAGWYGMASGLEIVGPWAARPGAHVPECPANGDTQPLEPPRDAVRFGNNGVHRVAGTVR